MHLGPRFVARAGSGLCVEPVSWRVRWAGFASLLVTACGADTSLHVPTPEFPSDAASVFYAVFSESVDPQVFAAPATLGPVSLELQEGTTNPGAIYAVIDTLSLEAHGLAPGLVQPSLEESARGLPSEHVLTRPLGVEDASWSPSTLPRELLQFRFASAIPKTRCVRLELRASYPHLDFSERPLPRPTLLPLDEERLLAFYAGEVRATVLTSTSASAFELGFYSQVRSQRALFRSPAGEIYIGEGSGKVRHGRPGGRWSELETASVTPPIGEELRWPHIAAMSAGQTANGDLELFAISYGYVSRVLPAASVLYERGGDISSRARSTAVWLGPDDLLFSLQDSGQAIRMRQGVPQVVLPASEVVGMRDIPGLGVFAVTATLHLLEWVREDGAFRTLSEDISGRDVAIAGNAERLFTLGEEGQLDQYVPGEGLCAPEGRPPLDTPSLQVFGRWLALTGAEAIEIYEMIPQR